MVFSARTTGILRMPLLVGKPVWPPKPACVLAPAMYEKMLKYCAGPGFECVGLPVKTSTISEDLVDDVICDYFARQHSVINLVRQHDGIRAPPAKKNNDNYVINVELSLKSDGIHLNKPVAHLRNVLYNLGDLPPAVYLGRYATRFESYRCCISIVPCHSWFAFRIW